MVMPAGLRALAGRIGGPDAARQLDNADVESWK